MLADTVIVTSLVIVPLLVVGLCSPSKYLSSEGLEAPWLSGLGLRVGWRKQVKPVGKGTL